MSEVNEQLTYLNSLIKEGKGEGEGTGIIIFIKSFAFFLFSQLVT